MRFPVRHRLSDGTIIEHDLYEATRFVAFETGDNQFPMASFGGTALLVKFRDRFFAVSAKHNAGSGENSFSWRKLVIKAENRGADLPHLVNKGAHSFDTHPDFPDCADLACTDLVVVEFVSEGEAQPHAYHWNEATVCNFEPGDEVHVQGYIGKDCSIETDHKSIITRSRPGSIPLEIEPQGSEPTLIRCVVSWNEEADRELGNLAGFSGAPVYNLPKNGLCGMVVRGGASLTENKATMWFIDACHVHNLLEAIVNETREIRCDVGVYQPLT